MKPEDDYAYCLTRDQWKDQCKRCKRNHNLYEDDGKPHYWIEYNQSKNKKCPSYVSLRKAEI